MFSFSEEDPDTYANTSHVNNNQSEADGGGQKNESGQSGTASETTKVIVSSDTKFPVDVVIALTVSRVPNLLTYHATSPDGNHRINYSCAIK